MLSTIPYNASLVLANVVDDQTLKVVSQISQAQEPVDDAQEELNNHLASRRSLDMTRTELANLGISTTDLDDALKTVNGSIGTAAANYAKERAESLVDYVKTEIKTMPLATDSMSMDVQFFSVDSNDEHGAAHAKAISAFVSSSNSFLGANVQRQLSEAAQSQTALQFSEHKITGTLVISASCTHKNASVLAPCILNVDKGVRAWNRIFKDDRLNPTNVKEMAKIAQAHDTEGKKRFSILSGVTYGSSFVGMVHIVNTKNNKVAQDLSTMVSSLQIQMDAGAWFAEQSGGVGVNATFGDEVKSLLSTQNVTSHVTLISMGVIPSIVANNVAMGVKEFAEFDPKSSMDAIASIQNATAAEQSSVGEAADAARTGAKMMSLKGSEIKSALSALGDIDDGQNKVLNINSLMTALEDYVTKVPDATSGVPLNYYLKDITKGMLAEMWLAKYFPGKYNSIQNDDSELTPKPTPES
ncbi:hypothetical protein B0J15DRAFT_573986 [Fusarium solani]|uniref:Uncharacterized protein n=1 Tax=Fusarium solani TaxID=169388 RepID=A0A9P9RCL5_FUSSL|nr:uncharacterized protein B0J15DRAFT_573986 [Fusarium solani]KAH7273145.1 hypothetical protein B0J15DRAFT_573986 [Fusarium solani]